MLKQRKRFQFIKSRFSQYNINLKIDIMGYRKVTK